MKAGRLLALTLIWMLAISVATAQNPAQKIDAVYGIPFDTEGNRIELTVSNETAVPYDEVEVVVVNRPVWMEIQAVDEFSATINPSPDQLYSHSSRLQAGATRGFAFVFSVDDSAPTEEVETLEFEVRSGGEVLTTKTIDISVELPKELVLRGNYPNPFNPSTTIGFVQPEDGTITLDVFDALGRQVDRLSKESSKRGQQTLSWNAASRASGVYFYRLQLDAEGGVTETRLGKMLLVK